jgi:hypothetical protein
MIDVLFARAKEPLFSWIACAEAIQRKREFLKRRGCADTHNHFYNRSGECYYPDVREPVK